MALFESLKPASEIVIEHVLKDSLRKMSNECREAPE